MNACTYVYPNGFEHSPHSHQSCAKIREIVATQVQCSNLITPKAQDTMRPIEPFASVSP